MSEKLESKIGKWLRKQILVINGEQGRCNRIILRHADPGKRGSNLWRKGLSDDVTGDAVDALATDIVEEVELHASGMGGVQRYVLSAYFEDSKDEAGATLPFRFVGHDERYDESEGESPTPMGLVAQTQRHLENVMRIHHATEKATMMTLARQNEILAEQNERLIRDRIEYFDKLEQARTLEHDRLLATAEHESSEARKNQLMEKAMLLLPVAVNRLAGAKVLPTEVSGEMEALASLARTLEPKQFESILAALKADQQIALIEILRKVQAADEAKKNGAYDKHKEKSS